MFASVASKVFLERLCLTFWNPKIDLVVFAFGSRTNFERPVHREAYSDISD